MERMVTMGDILNPAQGKINCGLRGRGSLAPPVYAEPVWRREEATGHHVFCHLA